MNDKEFRLEGLTIEQVKMLDKMWSIDSHEDFLDWLDNLSSKELFMAKQLQTLLMFEIVDSTIADDVSQVKKYLKKFQLK